MDRRTFRNIITLISYAALLILLVSRLDSILALLKKVVTIFKPLGFGFLIAFILSRPCGFFERMYRRILPRKVERAANGLAVLTSYALLFVIVFSIFTMILPQLYESLRNLVAGIYVNLPTIQAALTDLLTEFHLDSAELMEMLPSLSQLVEKLLHALSSTVPHIVTFTASLFSSSVTLITSIMLSIYILANRSKLVSQADRILQAYAAPTTSRFVRQVSRLTADTFTNFVSGQLIEAAILGVLCFIGMVILRFPFAPLISVIIAVTAIVPIAGPYVGAALSALLLVMVSPPQALGFLIFICVLQQLEGNLIYPRVVGSSIGLPALWVLTAVVVGGGLLGLWGMLLGVPIASVCYALLRQDVNARLDLKPKKK